MELILRPLTVNDREEAIAANRELAQDNWGFLLSAFDENEPWEEFLARVEREHLGVNLPEGKVPATFLVAEVGGEIVGRSSIRHALNDFLFAIGGHIGYGVRPAFRRKGYATEILRQSLLITDGLGITKVLVTCDDENIGSATVIESCGGELENKVSDGDGTLKRRYWISR